MGEGRESDAELLQAWRDGDRERGNRLFARHVRSISAFFRSKLPEAAEDLTQRTFLALVEQADRFRGDSSVRTYLYAIARKQLLMHLRTLTTDRRRFDPASWSLVDAGAQVTQPLAKQQEAGLLLAALQTLPVDYQIALELFYWEDMEVAAIAEVLEAPVGTIKSRLSRGRTLLGTAIENLAPSLQLQTSVAGDLARWMRALPGAVRRGGDPEP
ncbi:MAG: sigma-70 family RNA polymerase sigma factor [Myxococcota bacterium]